MARRRSRDRCRSAYQERDVALTEYPSVSRPGRGGALQTAPIPIANFGQAGGAGYRPTARWGVYGVGCCATISTARAAGQRGQRSTARSNSR